MDVNVPDLLDPLYREHVISSIRDWLRFPRFNPPETSVPILEARIGEPLEGWIKREFTETGGRQTRAITAAHAFAEDVNELSRALICGSAQDRHVDGLAASWREFQIQAGWDAQVAEGDFRRGQRERATRRRSVVVQVIEQTARRHPLLAPEELWPHFFAALEEDEQFFDARDMGRKWKRTWRYLYSFEKNGKIIEKTITYKTFQNIVSALKTRGQKKLSR